MPDLNVFPDTDALAHAAAQEISDRLAEAIAARGRATFVLTGGGTPKPVYERLGEAHADALDWGKVHVFWGDDRFVPPDHEKSNAKLAEKHLFSGLDIPEGNRHPIPTTLDEPGAAAAAYESTLKAFFGDERPAWDVLLLGMGPDLHIGSLWPGTDDVTEAGRWVLHTQSPPDQPVTDRVTMTMPLFRAGLTTLFLVAGEEKADAVHAVLDGGEGPAAQIDAQDRLAWYLDEAAAAKLEGPE